MTVTHRDECEWRNRQPGMYYRRLGRTNLMVSEMVAGGDPIRLNNYRHLSQAFDRGVNYYDMAPRYNDGETEKAIGLWARGVGRQNVFLATKVSGLVERSWALYRDVFDGLPEDRKRRVLARMRRQLEDRQLGGTSPGTVYFPGQVEEAELSCLAQAVKDEMGQVCDAGPALSEFIVDSVEESLQRVCTDAFDVLFCPHGAATPGELMYSEIPVTFQALKNDGKVRYLGTSSHNDPGGVLARAAELSYYDVAMVAYNFVNHASVDGPIDWATSRSDIGVIAMKVAMVVATHHSQHLPIPPERFKRLDAISCSKQPAHIRAYMWALQNGRISAVISNWWNEHQVVENLSAPALFRRELQDYEDSTGA